MTRRTDRIGHLIQRELSEQIQRGLKDPRVGFVTISRVEVSADLAHAKVFVSILGGDKDERSSIAGLKSSASYLRSHLARIMNTRTVPSLNFQLDKNLDHGFRIQELLHSVKDDLIDGAVKKVDPAIENSKENLDAATGDDSNNV